ncbi:hypothetical protein KCP76_20330 [Salmonella enterica subsp. enterica serovar Weltevreden]|nr:hypothetical protein KCP76_20330 [Salmonella enterica subsp. enterica serovar Weltevreden]
MRQRSTHRSAECVTGSHLHFLCEFPRRVVTMPLPSVKAVCLCQAVQRIPRPNALWLRRSRWSDCVTRPTASYSIRRVSPPCVVLSAFHAK